MASAVVSWFGDMMNAVPLRNNKAAATTVRTVTVLGATGSIGDSTMDLLRASPERYQVEALTAPEVNCVGLRPPSLGHGCIQGICYVSSKDMCCVSSQESCNISCHI